MGNIATNRNLDRLQLSSFLPVGTVLHYASITPPDGWLVCDGSLIKRADFPALYAVIGTTYSAGDGSTTFGLPNLLGEFIRGWDKNRGVDSGRSFGSSQTDELKSHSHVVPGEVAASTGSSSRTVSGNQTGTNNGITQLTGGSETRPRNVALLPIIKAVNIIGYDPQVQGSNADLLDGLHASAFALLGGSSGQLFQVANGVGTNDAVNMGQFGWSIANGKGYQKLPSGIIVQWMDGVTMTTSGYTTSLPIAFPNAPRVLLGMVANSGINTFKVVGYFPSTSTVWFACDGNVSGYCIAIGN